jgi:excisionase family DNA binding protein
MTIDLVQLPTWAKLEVTKGDLIAFAQSLMATTKVAPSVPVKEIMTIADAMVYLNLAKPTLYRMTAHNEVPFIKKNHKVYFHRTDLEKWLLEGKQKTRSEVQAEAAQFIEAQKVKRAKR